jgi:hypothetical protein
MNRALFRMTALGALLALAAAACGGGAGDRDTQAAPPAVPCDAPQPVDGGGPAEGNTEAAGSAGGAEAEQDRRVSEGAPPTARRLAGIWRNESPGSRQLLVRFGPGKTFAIDNNGLLDTRPWSSGTYEVDGRTVTLLGTAADQWAWVAGISEDGRLHTVMIYDHTAHVAPGTEWTWTRVSPSSPAGAQITAEAAAAEGPPPKRESDLFGIWLLEGTGHLLRFSTDGTYALADEGRLGTEPDDQGTLTLTSGAESRTCAEGTSWVWKDVGLIFGAGTLWGVVTKDDGQRDLGPDLMWVRLSP